MKYGVCPLSIISLKAEPHSEALLLNQILYGEHFKVLEQRKYWSKIRLFFDKTEGWILNNQFQFIQEDDYKSFSNIRTISTSLVEFIQDHSKALFPIPIGSMLNCTMLLNHSFEGEYSNTKQAKSNIIPTALFYLKSPFLNGGKTPFGIDASGLTQMVYKLNGYAIPRFADMQVNDGDVLSFIEESEPGDLAFFDNNEGEIIHVGLIMADNYIIHCSGSVRIDRLDQTGIYNADERRHTHKLRVIKQII